MFGTPGMRIPEGASDDSAAIAERLQFTAREGPCLDAHASSQTVMPTEIRLRSHGRSATRAWSP